MYFTPSHLKLCKMHLSKVCMYTSCIHDRIIQVEWLAHPALPSTNPWKNSCRRAYQAVVSKNERFDCACPASNRRSYPYHVCGNNIIRKGLLVFENIEISKYIYIYYIYLILYNINYNYNIIYIIYIYIKIE